MSLSTEDRLAIHELLSLHGHLADDGRQSDLHLLVAEDGAYDLSDFGLGIAEGLPAIRRLFETAAATEQPLGHHITNVIVTEGADGVVRVHSKGIAIMAGGRAGTAVYDDIVRKTGDGWRIVHRKIRRAAKAGPAR